jgi:Domain of unknown function (DUF4157)
MIHEQVPNLATQRKASIPKPTASAAPLRTFDPLPSVATSSPRLPAEQTHAAMLRGMGNDRSSTRRFLLLLQQDYGNRHVQQVLSAASREISVQPGKITSGVIEFYRAAGIAPTPPVTAAPPPVQRRSWIEHEPGVPDGGRERAVAMNGDYENFSRSGAQSLPGDARAAAEEHHRTSLGNVTLLRGGQTDSYCESISAAAFCTPSGNGGSDIFVHSGVDLNTPQGHHTLQHEISHAVQFQRGETSQLDGLGGNETVRERLENHADRHADAVIAGSVPS